jgi:hypothetical protein
MGSKFVLDESFYTYYFYENARKQIKKRVPIVIPSYNASENNILLDFIRENSTKKDYWPVFVVVRHTQKAAYEKNYSDVPGITFIGMKDSLIAGSGKVRREINNYFTGKYKSIFVMDDDTIPRFMARAYSADGSERYSVDYSKTNIVNIFSMWQVAHEWLMEQYPHAHMTFLYNRGFIFDLKYARNHCYTLGGKAGCAMCIELDRLKKYNLNYLSNEEINGGFDDADLLLRGLPYGVYPIKIAFMTCEFPPMSIDCRGSQEADASVDNRIVRQWEALYDIYKDKDVIRDYIKLNKKGNLIINWRRFFKNTYPEVATRGSIYDKVHT